MKSHKNYNSIDIDAVLRDRVPGLYRWLPGCFVSLAKKIICQDDLNRQLRINAGKEGADFCHGVLADLDVRYHIDGADNMPAVGDCRKIFVCNHPLGGLDGIIMIDWISSRYKKPVFFVVNDLLSAIKPLENVFLPVNKHGKQSRYSAVSIDEAFDGDSPIIMFPAGLVSRRCGNNIADLVWNKMFVNRAIRHHRDIVPIYFDGRNSSFFYNFARLRVALGVKFNYEMICLPSEVFKSRGKRFTLKVGAPIEWQSLKGGVEAAHTADKIRSLVYSLY